MDFKEEVKNFFEALGEHKKFVLSTSYKDHVTSRMMSCVMLNNYFYMQTDINFMKYKQIVNNSTVALCIDNIQIEGVAEITGSPSDLKNKQFVDLFKKHYPDSYNKYTNLEDEVVIKVNPSIITCWCYRKDIPYRRIIDFNNFSANDLDYIPN